MLTYIGTCARGMLWVLWQRVDSRATHSAGECAFIGANVLFDQSRADVCSSRQLWSLLRNKGTCGYSFFLLQVLPEALLW